MSPQAAWEAPESRPSGMRGQPFWYYQNIAGYLNVEELPCIWSFKIVVILFAAGGFEGYLTVTTLELNSKEPMCNNWYTLPFPTMGIKSVYDTGVIAFL